MLQKLTMMKNREEKNEEGFTLIEIAIVLVILGTLSTFSYIVVNEQIRQAQIGTLKADIRANIPYVLTSDGEIATPEDFALKAKSTDVNVVSLAVDGSREAGGKLTACVWGTRVFSDNDVVSFFWSSETGKMKEGTCLGEYPNAVIVGTGTPEKNPVEEDDQDHNHDDEGEVGSGDIENPPTGGEVGSGGVENPDDGNNNGNPGSNDSDNGEVGSGGVTNPGNDDDGDDGDPNSIKVVICHQQGNGKQSRWVSISPNNNGTLNGHIPQHNGDIVPPIDIRFPNGFNWTPENIEIWNNGCKEV